MENRSLEDEVVDNKIPISLPLSRARRVEEAESGAEPQGQSQMDHLLLAPRPVIQLLCELSRKQALPGVLGPLGSSSWEDLPWNRACRA